MKKFILILAVLFVAFTGAKTFAKSTEQPLMVIRFNQDFVDYEGQLEKVVKSAVNIKDSVFFDIVAVVPVKGPRRQDKRSKKQASAYAAEVVENIKALGIDENKIRVNLQNDTAADSIETHIFVR